VKWGGLQWVEKIDSSNLLGNWSISHQLLKILDFQKECSKSNNSSTSCSSNTHLKCHQQGLFLSKKLRHSMNKCKFHPTLVWAISMLVYSSKNPCFVVLYWSSFSSGKNLQDRVISNLLPPLRRRPTSSRTQTLPSTPLSKSRTYLLTILMTPSPQSTPAWCKQSIFLSHIITSNFLHMSIPTSKTRSQFLFFHLAATTIQFPPSPSPAISETLPLTHLIIAN